MKAFYWMMLKTASIPENSGSKDFFPYFSRSTPSAIRHFHVLVVIITVYHVAASKRYIIRYTLVLLLVDTGMTFSFLFQILQEYTTESGSVTRIS